MRLIYGTLAMVGLVSVGSSLLGACSNDASNCELTNTCSSGASGSSSTGSSGSSGVGGGSSSSSSSTSSSSGSGGSGGATPMSCVPTDVAGGVADDCGVFVSASLGKDANTGLGKKQAVQTLAHAIKIAGMGKKRIYACAEDFVEAAVVPTGFEIYGGLNCGTDWSHSATKTGITPGPDEVPLTLQGGAKATHIEDLAPTAMDATPATGGSSIAVIADGVTAEIVNCDLTVGKGAAGVPGVAPMGTGTPGADAPLPIPSTALDGCISAMSILGGSPGSTTCAGNIDASGGSGGVGQAQGAGAAGSNAATFPEPNSVGSFDGKGGTPQTSAPAAQCVPGDGGASGNDGTSGAGASGLGDISGSGYVAPPAMPGATPGQPGYGGGGGGGAKKCANNFAGPAGGGGGAGGCGGQPGAPGGSAGSSIGLVSNAATLTLNGVKITTSDGGVGGLGGGGQVGGQGGNPGLAGGSNGDGTVKACAGGNGGLGGRGGSGGGGLGGHSIGIATKAGKVTQTNVTIAVTTGGVGGIGGDSDMTPGVVGEGGKACKTLAFDTIDCVQF